LGINLLISEIAPIPPEGRVKLIGALVVTCDPLGVVDLIQADLRGLGLGL